MSKKALLLNQAYQGLGFINYRRAIKLLVKEHVELIDSWDDKIYYGRGFMYYPAIVRLNRYVPRYIKKKQYSRTLVFRRDKFRCQYCGCEKKPKDLTIDHVVPRDLGGDTTWTNCVASCWDCNNVKGNRTPKQAGMRLLHKPFAPNQTIWHEYNLVKNKHPSWEAYIVGNK